MLKRIRVDESIYDLDGTLAEAKDKIDVWIKEYGATATIDFDIESYSYDSGNSIVVKICYEREETNEEKLNRIRSDKKEREARLALKEKQFEALKKELGK